MSGGDFVAGNVSIDGIVTVKHDLLERETINTLAEFSAPADLYQGRETLLRPAFESQAVFPWRYHSSEFHRHPAAASGNTVRSQEFPEEKDH